jgi:hypothetical protein
VINSLGGEQNNVVFMGRRSFRMEMAEGARSNQLAIPMSASSVPTARIFASDRERAGWESAATALRPTSGRSYATAVALCLTTFVLGIALTLTFNGRAAPRRAPEVALAPPAPVVAPVAAPATTATEPTVVIQPLLVAAPTDAELLAGFPLAPARHPLAKPARAARPRPVRAARPAHGAEAEPATETTKETLSADPFADPAPTTKPAAKTWVDPFAE